MEDKAQRQEGHQISAEDVTTRGLFSRIERAARAQLPDGRPRPANASSHGRGNGVEHVHSRAAMRVRLALGYCCVALLVATIAIIWLLTAQTPEETTALTKTIAFAIDDVMSDQGLPHQLEEASVTSADQRHAAGVTGSRSVRAESRETGRSIEVKSEAREVREGDYVEFSVHVPDAIAYHWECTDDLTDGWYEISGVDMDSDTLRFELRSDRIWMQNCRFRCVVTYAGGSTELSDEVGFEYRDVSALGGVYRRAAHVAEFGLVGIFASLAVILLRGESGAPRSLLLPTLIFCAVNSLIDQTHKLFVPGREFDIFDLPLDALGYSGAAILVFAVWSVLRGSNRGRRGGGLRSEAVASDR